MSISLLVPSSLRKAITVEGVSVLALTTVDSSTVVISHLVPKDDATTSSEVATQLIEQGVFVYPLGSLSLVVLSLATKTASISKFTILNLNGDRRIVTGAASSGPVELNIEEGVAEAALQADADARDVAFWIRGAPSSLSGGVQPSGLRTHVAVTHLTSSTVNGGLLTNLPQVITTATQRQATPAGLWLVDVGSTCNNSLQSSSPPQPITAPATIRGVVFQGPSKGFASTIASSSSSLESYLCGSSPAFCPGSKRYLVPADGIHSCVPLVVCSESDVTRKTTHRAVGLPLSKGLLRARAGVVCLEEALTSATSLRSLLPTTRTGGTDVTVTNPEAYSRIEDVIPNNGEPSKIKRLVMFEVGSEGKKDGPAINLAALTRPKTVAKGVCSIVKCPLDYYHYRIDGFGDDGWGCAYRSLQLILSWFQRMGYTDDAKMPTLVEIQKILSVVDPDKSSKANFVGSKEWIGSFEVMMVLQHFVPGLDCTIQRMESAKELDSNPSILRTLQTHFEKGGAPVMIGGSNYAHTIIGLDVNVRTLDAQFLIVDPHYPSSSPECSVIVSKGWVGWKEASKFFDAKSWYNMCIPRNYEMDAS